MDGNIENLFEIPIEIWKQIFDYIPKIKDNSIASRVCKKFKLLINDAASIVDDASFFSLSQNIADLYPNLYSCKLENATISSNALDKLLLIKSLKSLTVMLRHEIFRDVWLSYWLQPTKTQEDFNSIHHSIILDNNQWCVLTFRHGILCHNGQFGNSVEEILKLLTKKYFIKFYDRTGFDHNLFASFVKEIYPNNIGIMLDSLHTKCDILGVAKMYSNITYIGVNFNKLWSIRAKTLEHYHSKYNKWSTHKDIDDQQITVIQYPNKIVIDVPVPLQFVTAIHKAFPNMISIRVITSESLPKIPDVKVFGYNQILDYCFE